MSHNHDGDAANLVHGLSALLTVYNSFQNAYVQWIVEDFLCEIETNLMFSLVGGVLSFVPLELHDRARRTKLNVVTFL